MTEHSLRSLLAHFANAPKGVSPNVLSLLLEIPSPPAQISVVDLAKKIKRERRYTTNLIADMHAKGWVVKHKSPAGDPLTVSVSDLGITALNHFLTFNLCNDPE